MYRRRRTEGQQNAVADALIASRVETPDGIDGGAKSSSTSPPVCSAQRPASCRTWRPPATARLTRAAARPWTSWSAASPPPPGVCCARPMRCASGCSPTAAPRTAPTCLDPGRSLPGKPRPCPGKPLGKPPSRPGKPAPGYRRASKQALMAGLAARSFRPVSNPVAAVPMLRPPAVTSFPRASKPGLLRRCSADRCSRRRTPPHPLPPPAQRPPHPLPHRPRRPAPALPPRGAWPPPTAPRSRPPPDAWARRPTPGTRRTTPCSTTAGTTPRACTRSADPTAAPPAGSTVDDNWGTYIDGRLVIDATNHQPWYSQDARYAVSLLRMALDQHLA
ncbi:hypothetical protein BX265_7176 [Streptomyces sp. TLI_235]|nr:hypothetical protein BX265_7176 [Streptomyces sp. TLI_235]